MIRRREKREAIDWSTVPVVPLRLSRCPNCGTRNRKPVRSTVRDGGELVEQRRYCEGCDYAWVNTLD